MSEDEPADAFALLADETRVAILRALAESWNEAGFGAAYGLSFSELRERVGVRDSSRFNYHLQRLTGRFVRKTDEGYVFGYPGWRLARAIGRGVHESVETEPVRFESDCYACGADELRARYVNEWAWVTCPDCGVHLTDARMPPEAFASRSPGELRTAIDRRTRRKVGLVLDGVCPRCLGTMEAAPEPYAWGPDELRRINYWCVDCDWEGPPSLAWHVLDHPPVVDFYADRGFDVDAEPYWHVDPIVDDDCESVVSRDPWRFEVAFPYGGDRLTVTLDGDGTPVGIDRPG
jgi:hypothetical protein